MHTDGIAIYALSTGLVIEPPTTQTANYNGNPTFLQNFSPPDTPLGLPVVCLITPTAIFTGSSNETYTFTLQQSNDGVTWTNCGVTGAAASVAPFKLGAFVSMRYVRLQLTVAGTTPSISYTASLTPNINPH
jgi:hypothetical protein